MHRPHARRVGAAERAAAVLDPRFIRVSALALTCCSI